MYDEKDILKQIPQIKKQQLPNLKSHLYKQLLLSLRLMHRSENEDIDLRERIDYARILYNKGLYRQSLDILDRAKENPDEIELLLIKMNADFLDIAGAIRKISKRLLPEKMEGDSFQRGIQLLCQNLERPGGGTIHFEAQGTDHKLPDLHEVFP